jgi:hypothetical protein
MAFDCVDLRVVGLLLFVVPSAAAVVVVLAVEVSGDCTEVRSDRRRTGTDGSILFQECFNEWGVACLAGQRQMYTTAK